MLRACVMDFDGSWEKYLHLVEFSYNNSFQTSIGMSPFEALYGRPCRSPICWTFPGIPSILGPPRFVQDASEQIAIIGGRIKAAQQRQKHWADKRRKDLHFEVGNQVFLKVASRRGLRNSKKLGKLNPRFVRPFQIPRKIGEVAYELNLPLQFAGVHNVFHISMLRRYVHHPSHIIDYKDMELQDDISIEERPVRILDRCDQVLRGKVIHLVKVAWSRHSDEEAT